MFWYFVLSIVSAITVMEFTSLGDNCSWYVTRRRKLVTVCQLFASIVTVVWHQFLKSNPSSTAKICDTQQCLSIIYTWQDQSFPLYMPFNKTLMRKWTGVKVYLIKDDRELEITQQPGLLYLITPSQIGGSGAKIVKGDKIVMIDKNEIIDPNKLFA